MQYLKVIVNQTITDLDAEFIYSCLPEFLPEIKIYSIVLVPFEKKIRHGLVVGFIRRLPDHIDRSEIFSIITPVFYLADAEKYLEIARHISSRWLISLGEAFFLQLPKFPLKPIPEFHLIPLSASAFSVPAANFGIFGTQKWRNKYYVEICQKVIAGNKVGAVIFPTQKQTEDFVALNPDYILLRPPKNRREIHDYFRSKSRIKFIAVGTRSLIFFQHPRLSTMIIDSPAHPGHYNDQKPAYHTEEIAELRCRQNINIVIGEDVRRIHDALKINFYTFSQKTANPKIIVKNTYYGIEEIAGFIASYRHTKEKLLVFLPKKQTPMSADYYFYCRNCQKLIRPDLKTCSYCQSKKIPEPQFGIKELDFCLRKKQIKSNIVAADENINAASSITLATHKIFDLLNIKFDTVLLLGFEWMLNLNSYNSLEELFLLIARLKMRAEKKLIIFVRPDSRFDITKLLDERIFLKKELAIRKKFLLPPFGILMEAAFRKPVKEQWYIDWKKLAEKNHYQIFPREYGMNKYLISGPKVKLIDRLFPKTISRNLPKIVYL